MHQQVAFTNRGFSMAIRSMLSGFSHCSACRPPTRPFPTEAALDAEAARAMAATQAKGLAIAVIDDGKVVHVRSYGARNAAGDPLRNGHDHVRRVADQGRVRLHGDAAGGREEARPGHVDRRRTCPSRCRSIRTMTTLRAMVQTWPATTLARDHPAHPADAQRRLRQLLFPRAGREAAFPFRRRAAATPIRATA